MLRRQRGCNRVTVLLPMPLFCFNFIYFPFSIIVTGGVNKQGQMTFGYCSYLKPYNVLSNFQLESLQGGYSCDCRVSKINTTYRSTG